MAFVSRVQFDSHRVALGHNTVGENNVDVIIGANGTGKTALLCAIARGFANGEGEVEVVGGVSRVISQTFSPFSRFPSGAASRRSVLSIYGDDEDRSGFYIPLGLTKDQVLRPRNLAKTVVERAIVGVSQNSERAGRFFEFLNEAGFMARCQVVFKRRGAAWLWLERFIQSPDAALVLLRNEKRKSSYRSALLREVGQEGWDAVREALITSISTLGEYVLFETEIAVEFGRESGDSALAYARLQALGVLASLGFVNLADVFLFRPSGLRLEVSNASSGEQQLLCSLLGLAGSLRSHSIVLIDEPELSLHPKWQIEFSAHVLSLLRMVVDCHVIIATHSPLVVQGFQGVGCSPVRLDEDWSATQVRRRRKRPVEEILVDLFKSPVPSSLYLSDELVRIINMDGPSRWSRYDQRERLEQLKLVYRNNSDELRVISRVEKVLEMSDD